MLGVGGSPPLPEVTVRTRQLLLALTRHAHGCISIVRQESKPSLPTLLVLTEPKMKHTAPAVLFIHIFIYFILQLFTAQFRDQGGGEEGTPSELLFS